MQQQMAAQKITEIHDARSFFEYIYSIKISPEVYGLFIFGIVIWYLRREIKGNKDLGERWNRLVATILSKKYLAWFVITCFFWYDHFVWQYDGLSFESYLTFTAVTFGIDVWQKKIGLDKKGEHV